MTDKSNPKNKIQAFTPFNFIPFDPKVTPVHPEIATLPSFSSLDPLRKSGHIDYTIENLTSIAIGAATPKKRNENNTKEVQGFFKDGNGKYAIPGSTIRGLVRSNAEILSFSDPGDMIADSKLLFRSFASNSKSLRNAYSQQMKDSTDEKANITGVQVGYICCCEDSSGKHYEIHPVKPFTQLLPYIPIKEYTMEDGKRIVNPELDKIFKTHPDYRMYINSNDPDPIINSDYKSYRMDISNAITFDLVNGKPVFGSGPYKGILVNSAQMGKEDSNTKKCHYLIPIEENGTSITIDPEYIDAYNKDYERNCIQNRKLKSNPRFYALPNKVGEKKLFFFKCHKTENRLIGFGPSLYFRAFYPHSVGETVPNNYQRKDGHIDYVHAMFGFVKIPNGDTNLSYRSRLSFQNATTQATVASSPSKAVLLEPKATAIKIYLEQPSDNPDYYKTYATDGAISRGYKVYHKRENVLPSDTHCDKYGNPKDISSIESMFTTIPKNSEFHGRIIFENLTEAELGLLLLSIQYHDGNNDTFMIGKGKPYGYGKVKITSLNLFEYRPDVRFTTANLNGSGFEVIETTSSIPTYKSTYKSTILGKPEQEYDANPTIGVYSRYQSLEVTDETITNDTVYMEPKEYTDSHILESLCDIVTRQINSTETKRKQEEKENREREKAQRIANLPKIICFGSDLKKSEAAIRGYIKDVNIEYKDILKPKELNIEYLNENYPTAIGFAFIDKTKEDKLSFFEGTKYTIFRQYKERGKLKIKKIN